MIKNNKLLIPLAIASLILGFLYLVSSILLPFIVALITAYFLNPAVDKIQSISNNHKISRVAATAIITCLFFVTVGSLIALLAPVIYEQCITFLHALPSYIVFFKKNIIPAFSKILAKIDTNALETARNSVGDASTYTLKFLGSMAANLLDNGKSVVNIISLIFITPVVTFYVLLDWHKIIHKIDQLLPKKYAATIRKIVLEIDQTLSAYIRGQTHVCLIIGLYYAVALSIAGLEFSIFIGLATGFLLFIPYAGTLFGLMAAIIVAFFQFGDIEHVLIVAAIFGVGQVVEGFFFTPKLVGKSIGLHPVWIIFALLAGGAMLGFVGVLIAVPVAAVVGVLVRHYI